jgi:hypothetical protein
LFDDERDTAMYKRQAAIDQFRESNDTPDETVGEFERAMERYGDGLAAVAASG